MLLSKLFSHAQKASAPTTSQRVLGVDIGSSAIKVVELQEKDGIVTLMNYGELQIGPYDGERSIGESVILSAPLERQALADIMREAAIKATNAVFAMPLSSSFVTTMTLPTGGVEGDMSSRIRVEARKYIPMPIADVTLDWAEIGSGTVPANPDREEDTVAIESVRILLAAIQNSALQRITGLKETLRFSDAPTEIECFSTVRAAYTGDETDVVVIDLGAISAKMYILEAGVLQRMHRARAGGALCTEAFAKERTIDFAAAEDIKRSTDKSSEYYTALQKIHHNHYDRVLNEFTGVLRGYQNETGKKVSNIVLTGGGSLFPGLPAFVADKLHATVTLTTPFERVAYPAFMEDALHEVGPTFATALGAALRSFE